MDLSRELEVGKRAALAAGARIMDVYREYAMDTESLHITQKSDDSPLTAADRLSNDIIVSYLKKNFPKHSILSEESKDDKARLDNKFCWIVDPLDGTKEFIKRNGEFTVNIALSYEHRVVLGVIYVPVTEELYFASKQAGAFYEQARVVQQIHVSERTDNIRMVMSRSHGSEELERIIKKYNITNTKSAGSSLKGCLVAKAEAEVYYRFNKTMEWDTAAMQCIAEEAGAIFRQMDDAEMLYNREDSLNDSGFYIINRPENKMVL